MKRNHVTNYKGFDIVDYGSYCLVTFNGIRYQVESVDEAMRLIDRYEQDGEE